MRIPEWTDVSRVSCCVNGREQDVSLAGRRVQVRNLRKGDEVVVQFPMREVEQFERIGGIPYRLKIKGNTVVDIDPEGNIYPLYQRDHYSQDKAPSRRVTRFVSEDRIEL